LTLRRAAAREPPGAPPAGGVSVSRLWFGVPAVVAAFSGRAEELENRTHNTIRVTGTDTTFPQLSTPTELQARALTLINERVPQIT